MIQNILRKKCSKCFFLLFSGYLENRNNKKRFNEISKYLNLDILRGQTRRKKIIGTTFEITLNISALQNIALYCLTFDYE